MKTKKYLLLYLTIVFMSLAYIVACGGGGNGVGPDPDPDPDPDPNPPSGISFDTGSISPGGSGSYTFDKTGSTDYVCTFHSSQMQGSVTVEDGASTDAVTVTMTEYSFSPADITIGPGTKVTWVNEGNMNHTATNQ